MLFAAHDALAACTRLPNAYNATPVNGAICDKSLPSNLSVFSPSPFVVALSLSPFSLSPFCTYTLCAHTVCTALSLSPPPSSFLSPPFHLILRQFRVFRIYTVCSYFHLIVRLSFSLLLSILHKRILHFHSYLCALISFLFKIGK